MTVGTSQLLSTSDAGEEANGQNFVVVPDYARYEKEHFVIPRHYEASISHVLVPGGLIDNRVERLALDITKYFGADELHILCILKGGATFFGKLSRYLSKMQCYSDGNHASVFEHYIRVKSYFNTESGQLQISTEDLSELKNKNVVIVEDIIDSGNTIVALRKHLQVFEPKEVKVASLVDKRVPKAANAHGDFVGFSVPNTFIVGYGLDYNEEFRSLEHICVLNELGISRYKL